MRVYKHYPHSCCDVSKRIYSEYFIQEEAPNLVFERSSDCIYFSNFILEKAEWLTIWFEIPHVKSLCSLHAISNVSYSTTSECSIGECNLDCIYFSSFIMEKAEWPLLCWLSIQKRKLCHE